MILAAQLVANPHVWATSYVEWVGLVALGSVIAGVAAVWQHIECHHDGCHRVRTFRHGHLRLCHAHHPDVPDDGKITDEHIKAVTNRLNSERRTHPRG